MFKLSKSNKSLKIAVVAILAPAQLMATAALAGDCVTKEQNLSHSTKYAEVEIKFHNETSQTYSFNAINHSTWPSEKDEYMTHEKKVDAGKKDNTREDRIGNSEFEVNFWGPNIDDKVTCTFKTTQRWDQDEYSYMTKFIAGSCGDPGDSLTLICGEKNFDGSKKRWNVKYYLSEN